MPVPRVFTRPTALFALILSIAACDGDRSPATPPSGATPSSLRVLSGDGQSGVAGAELPQELAVGAVDAGGNALPGMAVQFVVVSGGGRVTPQTATSDAQGWARVRWTLGTVAADSQVVEARREGLPPVRLRASVRPDVPATLSVTAGNGASGAVGAALDSLAVTVKDRHGNPIVGLPVTWAVATGGGSVSPAQTVTGAGGVSKTQWTLGLRVDSAQGVVVRVAGLDSVAFTANAVTAGVPLQLAKRGGDGQRGPAGSVLLDSLGVVLRMPDGRPVQGAVVNWSVPAAAGTVTPAVSRTDANGAASAVWRLGTSPGLVQATATVDEGTLVFTSLVEASAPTGIVAVAGGGEGPVGGAMADSLAVRVTDTYGNPVPGAEIAWSVQSGGGAVQPARSTTDAAGIARTQWTLGTGVGAPQAAQAQLGTLAPVTFQATTTTRGVPLQLAKRGGDGQRGPAGSVLLDSLGVVLRTPDGRPVQGALVTWSVPAAAGTVTPATSRTNAEGLAFAAWRLGTSAGLVQATATVDEGTLTFTARIEAAAPAHIAAVAGGGEGPVGGAMADSLAVRVTDQYGNPVSGVEVAWAAQTGGGSVQPAASTTDAQGMARAQWTLGPIVGTPGQTASATLGSLPPVAFQATAITRGVTLQLVRVGGDEQTGEIGAALADSLVVRLRTAAGVPVQGATVQWRVLTGGGQISPTSVRTDAQGHARAAWTMGSVPGPATASAQVDEGALLFTAAARAGSPAAVQVVSGNNQSATRGTILADSLVARVVDAHGTPLAGVPVQWNVLSGDGHVQHTSAQTGPDGTVRTRWAVGLAPGDNSAAASVGGLAARFTATSRPGTLTLHSRSTKREEQVGNTVYELSGSLAAWVTDATGARVIGAPIRWDLGGMYPVPLPSPSATPGWDTISIVRLRGTEFGMMSIPALYAVAYFEEQRAIILNDSYIYFYERTQHLVEGPGPYLANDTAVVVVLFTETSDLYRDEWNERVPLRLYDDNGWSLVTDSYEPIPWPLGSKLGPRTVTVCLPEPYAIPEECWPLAATVVP
ncbi:Ig-like domain-containing protein [Longimicrobium sp.]|uniref:Ig-like domain-containing protein n=1 Tax=Longimicrobium sp. TaxID=2029185 RepID=UPI002E341E08|nr:Ig-like domain-containing protein [Longimicrobium sp.]HEX6041452.1 Ig-like domain-containing protein [Longimicrobium sp.]